jgi:predicted O-methyltransferase YrrM
MMTLEEIASKHHDNFSGFCRHYLLLYSLVLGMEAKSVFEFGCGVSSKVILSALQLTGGKLMTCDQKKIEDTGHTEADLLEDRNWRYLQGKSSETVSQLTNETFDFVLHDGSHDRDVVRDDIRNLLPRMKKNALLVIHDTEHPIPYLGLPEGVENALAGCQHSKVTLPYGYGLTLVRVEEDLGNGDIKLAWQKKMPETTANSATPLSF